MIVALSIQALIIAGQFVIIWALINRLLQRNGVQSITIPSPAATPTEPPEDRRRKFGVFIGA